MAVSGSTTIFAPFHEINPADYKRATEVTYFGYVWGTMAALRRMRPRNRGTIVQIASALAYRAIPLQSPYCGAKHAIGCSNGTDALKLCLLAKGVKAGDAVFCPSFTFAATAEVVALVGATPWFVDIHEDTFNMDPASLKTAIAEAKKSGLRLAGVIAVDLFGQPAGYRAIEPIAAEEGMWLMCDAAQSFGASYHGRRLGTFGQMTTTSFFPAKPLGW